MFLASSFSKIRTLALLTRVPSLTLRQTSWPAKLVPFSKIGALPLHQDLFSISSRRPVHLCLFFRLSSCLASSLGACPVSSCSRLSGPWSLFPSRVPEIETASKSILDRFRINEFISFKFTSSAGAYHGCPRRHLQALCPLDNYVDPEMQIHDLIDRVLRAFGDWRKAKQEQAGAGEQDYLMA